METFGGVLAAIFIAVLIAAIFYYGFSSRGPWGSFWTFFLVLLLVIWAASLWTRPVGPVYWGVAWVPLFFVGLIFALLLAAIPTADSTPEEEELVDREVVVEDPDIQRRREAEVASAAAIGWIFWVFILILFTAIIIGYVV